MEDILAISHSEMNFAGFEAAEALCESDTFMLRKAKIISRLNVPPFP